MNNDNGFGIGRIITWNLTLVGILSVIITSEKEFSNEDYFFLLVAVALFTIPILLYSFFAPRLYKILSTNIAFESFFSSKYSLGTFYNKLYSFVVIFLVLMTVAYHTIDTSFTGSFQIGSYTVVTTLFLLSAYFLSRIGTLKFRVLKQKLINQELGADVIIKKMNVTVDIQDRDAEQAFIIAEYDFICLKDLKYHQLKSSLKGESGNIEILDTHNCSLHKEGNGVINLRSIRENLKEGETINYMYSGIAEGIFPDKKEEFWFIDNKHFTQFCTFTIKFHKDKPVKNKKCVSCPSKSEQEIKEDEDRKQKVGNEKPSLPTPILYKSDGRDILVFQSDNLSTKECYKLTWEW